MLGELSSAAETGRGVQPGKPMPPGLSQPELVAKGAKLSAWAKEASANMLNILQAVGMLMRRSCSTWLTTGHLTFQEVNSFNQEIGTAVEDMQKRMESVPLPPLQDRAQIKAIEAGVQAAKDRVEEIARATKPSGLPKLRGVKVEPGDNVDK